MPRSTKPAKNLDSPQPHPAAGNVRDDVLAAVAAAASKLTPLDLLRRVIGINRHTRRQIRAAIRQLMAQGELNYIHAGGRTLIELSFNRPVQVSKRIILVPAGRSVTVCDDAIVVIIKPGASFGDGRHPSTRLALAGVEVACKLLCAQRDLALASVLDIGTGSGVLVLAAVKLGFGQGLGLDIDPCAVSEAVTNAGLNHLESRIQIAQQSLEKRAQRFALITANLRWPTLRSARNRIRTMLEPGGLAVLSGIKADEISAVIDWYAAAGFRCRRRQVRHDWASAVLSVDHGLNRKATVQTGQL